MRIPLALMASLLALLTMAESSSGATPTGVKPSGMSAAKFAEVQRIVSQYFHRDPDFRSTDLFTREDAVPLLAQLQKKKLLSVDADVVLEKLPSQQELSCRTVAQSRREKVHATDRVAAGRLRSAGST